MTDGAPSLQSGKTGNAAVPGRIRSRLFLKYAGLFVAVVCVALVTNGLFEMDQPGESSWRRAVRLFSLETRSTTS